MATQGGRGETIYCAILIAKYNGGGVAIKEVLNAKNSIDSCLILESTNEYLVKANPPPLFPGQVRHSLLQVESLVDVVTYRALLPVQVTYIHTHTHTHIHMVTYIHTYTHTHTHTHIYI